MQGLRHRIVRKIEERDDPAVAGLNGRSPKNDPLPAASRSWHERISDRVSRLEKWADQTIKEKMREIRALSK